MSGEEIAIFERLAEHELRLNDIGHDGWRWDCACGEWGRAIGPEPSRGARNAHRAHVAQALAPLVEQAEREAAAKAWDEGVLHLARHLAISVGSGWLSATNPYRAERAQGAAGGGA